MAQSQTPTNSTSANPGTTGASSSTTAPSNETNLYPVLESTIAPLELGDKYARIVQIERDLVTFLRDLMPSGRLLDDIADKSILPTELFTTTKKAFRPKLDPLKKLKDLPGDEVEDEEEQEDEEEDEEQEVIEDEEEDAGGDYLVSHFDNGENFEDNDDEGDDMSGMM